MQRASRQRWNAEAGGRGPVLEAQKSPRVGEKLSKSLFGGSCCPPRNVVHPQPTATSSHKDLPPPHPPISSAPLRITTSYSLCVLHLFLFLSPLRTRLLLQSAGGNPSAGNPPHSSDASQCRRTQAARADQSQAQSPRVPCEAATPRLCLQCALRSNRRQRRPPRTSASP